jgi:hypothetical protein
MKKQSIALGILMTIFVSMLICPVLAYPENKFEVTATQKGGFLPPTPEAVDRHTPGGIEQHRDFTSKGAITLNFPDGTVTGTSSSVADFIIIPKTDFGVYHLDMTWTFASGTFEGQDQMRIYYDDYSVSNSVGYREAHMVMQGTGNYEGYTLVLDGYSVLGQPMAWTGYLIT